MKRITTIVITALAGITLFTSCKKDYKCTCTWNVGGTTQSNSVDLKGMSKKDAKNACEGKVSNYGGFTSVSCKLD